uniref:NADH-ubiquinone oxidoreductase chain 3 n=1 Tax=Loxosomella aloxiata TaxID=393182 RepID=B1B1X1_9BILA|nr:NADH dehydrogenase subunit 3 [Loxosomella aloxiata]BAG12597.1 NADH dehydrogenase subunit 3 [Loxosomella aloxiata]
MGLTFLMCLLSFFLAGVFLGLFLLLSGRFLADREKSSPFECGFDPKDSARIPFSMRYFLLAVIFLVFDLEIVLLIPLVLMLSSMKSLGCLLSGMLFIIILFFGVLYEWWEGSFNWIY